MEDNPNPFKRKLPNWDNLSKNPSNSLFGNNSSSASTKKPKQRLFNTVPKIPSQTNIVASSSDYFKAAKSKDPKSAFLPYFTTQPGSTKVNSFSAANAGTKPSTSTSSLKASSKQNTYNKPIPNHSASTQKKSTSWDSSKAVKNAPTAKPASPAVPLSPEQQYVLDLVVNQRKSLFFTGGAGTSILLIQRHLISRYWKEFPAERID